MPRPNIKRRLATHLDALQAVDDARKQEIITAAELGDAVCLLNDTTTNSKCRAVIGNQLVEVTPTHADPSDANAAREHGDAVYRIELSEVVSV